MFNADLALSVTMTAISTLLSTIFLPVNLLIYARYSYEADVIMALDWTSLFVALAIVIGAIGLGLFCSAKIHSHKFNLMANHVRNTDVQCIVGLSFSHFLNYNQLGNWAGIALIIFSATMTNTGGEDTKIWERDWKFYVGTTLPCLLGLIIANLVTSTIRLKKPERVCVH
jgi:predicted Na+-dependent transporter